MRSLLMSSFALVVFATAVVGCAASAAGTDTSDGADSSNAAMSQPTSFQNAVVGTYARDARSNLVVSAADDSSFTFKLDLLGSGSAPSTGEISGEADRVPSGVFRYVGDTCYVDFQLAGNAIQLTSTTCNGDFGIGIDPVGTYSPTTSGGTTAPVYPDATVGNYQRDASSTLSVTAADDSSFTFSLSLVGTGDAPSTGQIAGEADRVPSGVFRYVGDTCYVDFQLAGNAIQLTSTTCSEDLGVGLTAEGTYTLTGN